MATKKKPVAKKRRTTSVKPAPAKLTAILVLKKKPGAGEVPPPVEENVIAQLEAAGGELPEEKLVPLLEATLPDAQTFWGFWRDKLEKMGILDVREEK